MEEKTFAAWRIKDKYGDIIAIGIDSPTEFNLDHLPGGWDGDRNIDEVQETMAGTALWEDNGYEFEYKLYELKEDMTIKKRGE